ncbi:MAG: hypothetical protein GC204_20395 [Chloroflexi bacterium]|nr:hypothetical protein [Chloroflexota bacterium]
MKKISLLIIAVIAAISVVGVVSAQDQTPPPAPAATGSGSILRQLLQVVADDLNLQPQDILQQMRGQSLADVIAANNGDLDKITADITSTITDRVNQAVTDGKMTQERADQFLGNLDTAVQNALQGNGPLAQRRNGAPGPLRGPLNGGLHPNMLGLDVRPLLKAAQDATQLTPLQLAQEIRGGKTLAEVITAHGGDPAAVETTAIASATQQLDKVRENGNLTQEQETSMLDGLKAFYDAILNGNFRPMTVTESAPI